MLLSMNELSLTYAMTIFDGFVLKISICIRYQFFPTVIWSVFMNGMCEYLILFCGKFNPYYALWLCIQHS